MICHYTHHLPPPSVTLRESGVPRKNLLRIFMRLPLLTEFLEIHLNLVYTSKYGADLVEEGGESHVPPPGEGQSSKFNVHIWPILNEKFRCAAHVLTCTLRCSLNF